VQDDLVCGLLRINFVQVPRLSQSLCYASEDALLHLCLCASNTPIDFYKTRERGEAFFFKKKKSGAAGVQDAEKEAIRGCSCLVMLHDAK
jgi:hypothetical protein